MPRNMSFMLTTKQMRNRTKTVTRRLGWWNVKPGEILNACEKCQGLRKGEKIKVIGQIRVLNVTSTRLGDITWGDVDREGFPKMFPPEFVQMFVSTHKGCTPDTIVNRIEFEHLEEEPIKPTIYDGWLSNPFAESKMATIKTVMAIALVEYFIWLPYSPPGYYAIQIMVAHGWTWNPDELCWQKPKEDHGTTQPVL